MTPNHISNVNVIVCFFFPLLKFSPFPPSFLFFLFSSHPFILQRHLFDSHAKEVHMGRKGSWFSSVKKVFGSDSKKDQKNQSHSHSHSHSHNHNKSKLACFGYHDHHHEAGHEGAKVTIVPSLPRKRETKPKIVKEENEQNKQALSLVFATAVAAGAAVAAAAEVARLKGTPRYSNKMKQEVAATKIQAAFRGYLARRKLRGLRGLARLKTLIQGQSVKRQSASTLQCMQTLSKLHSQVRARRIRMSEENQALQRQLQQKREREFEKLQASQEKWDDSLQSKEQIETRLLNKQVAAMRREKALAYSMTHQQTWRNPLKSANATFMDPNNPHWGWNWLERWMAARPWEGQNTLQHNEHSHGRNASTRSTMSVGEITKLYTHRDQSQNPNNNNIPSSLISSRARSQNSPSTQASSKSIPPLAKSNMASSPRVGSWGGDSDSKKYVFGVNPERNRRHSIAGSPVKDDESFTSAPAVASPRVAVTKAKPRVQSSPSSLVSKKSVGTKTSDKKEVSDSAKKRLSLPSSPAHATRRLSTGLSKVGMTSNNRNVSVKK